MSLGKFIAGIAVAWMLTSGLCSGVFLVGFLAEALTDRKGRGGDGIVFGWEMVPIPVVLGLIGVGSGYLVHRAAKKSAASATK